MYKITRHEDGYKNVSPYKITMPDLRNVTCTSAETVTVSQQYQNQHVQSQSPLYAHQGYHTTFYVRGGPWTIHKAYSHGYEETMVSMASCTTLCSGSPCAVCCTVQVRNLDVRCYTRQLLLSTRRPRPFQMARLLRAPDVKGRQHGH